MSIERPIITEKSMDQAQNGVYTFAVDRRKTKPAIAQAVQQLYGVTVEAVRVQSVIGKVVRRKKGYGRRRDWKKALITLKKGQIIKDFALPEEQSAADNKKTDKSEQSATNDNKADKAS